MSAQAPAASEARSSSSSRGPCQRLPRPQIRPLHPLRYNEVIRDTNDEQLLINIVRLRYADSPVFIDLPNITSQFEVAGMATIWRLRQPARPRQALGSAGCRSATRPP